MLIGLSAHPGDADSMRRQEQAGRQLMQLRDVQAVNLQFRAGSTTTLADIETLPVLTQDSLVIAGPGRRSKPITRELFDVLARLASTRGQRYFAYINSDIIVRPEAIDAVREGARETYAICRHDVDSIQDMHNAVLLTAGIDMFVLSVEWWNRHQRRFRPYIVGDACWDDVYTAVMMCHSDGVILNRDPLILHERHPTVWNDATSSARYNGFLAALDARYFDLWCTYFDRLEQLRASGATEQAEQILREEIFVWRPSAAEAVKQSLRSLRARWRFHRLRSAAMATTASGHL
jgi:hypothetical protein